MKKITLGCMLLLTFAMLTACGTKAKPFTKGSVTGNVYTSQFGEFKLTAPSGWSFADQKEYQSTMDQSTKMVANEYGVDQKDIEEVAVTDTMCINRATNDNLIIQYNNLGRNANIDMDDFMDELDKMLSSAGFMSFKKIGNTENITLAGQDFLKAHYSTTLYNMTAHQYYYIRKEGTYLIQAIVTLTGDTTDISDIEKCFAPLD